MADFPALPIWTDALLGDTQHLTTAEFGAYMLMLIVAWRSPDCALPNDENYLMRITRTGSHWPRMAQSLMPFWQIGGDGKLRQKRLTKTRVEVAAKSQKASNAAKARWATEPPVNGPTAGPNVHPIKK